MAHFMDYGEQVSLASARRPAARGASRWRRSRTAARSTRSTVEISDDEFVVDLRDNPDQDHGPNNASRDGAMVAAQMLFKNLTDPHGVANDGSFRPLTLLTRPGSVFDAREPAAFGGLLRGR